MTPLLLRILCPTVLMIAASPAFMPGQTHAELRGDARDASNHVLPNIQVTVNAPDGTLQSTRTDAAGTFILLNVPAHSTVCAEDGQQNRAMLLVPSTATPIHLILKHKRDGVTCAQSVEFSDAPNFTIASVTDWTAIGGHGSDATLRTSEELTHHVTTQQPTEPIAESADPARQAELQTSLHRTPLSYEANKALGAYYLGIGMFEQAEPLLKAAVTLHGGVAEDEFALAKACKGLGDFTQARQHVQLALQLQDAAEFHRFAGDLEERLGNPLAAVQQFERAAQIDPSEANYFAWGSEMLVHRAIWQASTIFQQGSTLYPQSARLRTAWGASLFAEARYGEASERLCAASNLDPTNRGPYVLLGKAALAAPEVLPCVRDRLNRLALTYPQDAEANYYDAMLLLKQGSDADKQRGAQMLHKVTVLNPRFADAYLQLGILEGAQHNMDAALALYRQAIAADSQLAEAHYRLGVALDRRGYHAEAQRELETHERLIKKQAEVVEQQRRQIKQFLVTQPMDSATP